MDFRSLSLLRVFTFLQQAAANSVSSGFWGAVAQQSSRDYLYLTQSFYISNK